MTPFDSEKTKVLQTLFTVLPQKRDNAWRECFLDVIADACMLSVPDQVINAPDGFLYFVLNTPPPGEVKQAFCLSQVLDFCLENAFGVVINPREGMADWVFHYGDLWHYKTHERFYPVEEELNFRAGTDLQKAIEDFDQDEQVMIGSPTEAFFPHYVRKAIKEFLSRIKTYECREPKVFLLVDPKRVPAQSLVFDLFVEDFPDAKTYAYRMGRLSWFFPKSLGLVGIPKKSHLISHFKAF